MTLPIRAAHDGLELPAIGFGTYRVQGLTSSPPSAAPSRMATTSVPGRFGEVVPGAASALGRVRRDRAQGHPHSLARMQIYSVI